MGIFIEGGFILNNLKENTEKENTENTEGQKIRPYVFFPTFILLISTIILNFTNEILWLLTWGGFLVLLED
jgi:hypothetical protein